MMSGQEDLWLHAATSDAETLAAAHQHGTFLTCYTLHLSSHKPLHQSALISTLTHLYRKVGLLRVCLRLREGQLWQRQMEHCIIDFKTVEGAGLEEVEEELTRGRYNTADGPLWCVRLLALPATQPSTNQDPALCHRYALLFGVHHELADGFTNIKICNMLHSILDDVVAGRPVDDEVQFGRHLDNELSQKLYQEEERKLLEDPELREKVTRSLAEGADCRPLLLDAFPASGTTDVKTSFVNTHFDKDMSQLFRQKCKSERVSLHCGLVGVINATFIALVKGRCQLPPELMFRAGHDVNIRRYYQGDTSDILGVHIPLFGFRIAFKTSQDLMSNFWPTVREFHKQFQSQLNDRYPLKNVALMLMNKSKSENIDEYFQSAETPDRYCTISNLGDVTSMFTGVGECVKVTKLTRKASIRAMNSFMTLYVHSLHGRLDVTIAFSTRFLDHNFAQAFMDTMNTTISTLCHA
nr:uncharacterized protein LOC123753897 [Procambarus clarkii]XP_045591815.1 uncharacterized protein LOC123753897 [Procambarus clarkii]XP_045591825.1 uncharacterized protein LOC123753897 [Procambarus clarkii]XP_045591834.1 uncharacterized protein LOC123753897 [Procambarus clarkii]XP_045591843.1 uncharacterized protein LOC123753897 [Procambarus clarkii]XP_045591852.1 uncharacterized protein LOC123753897 [Procambarus clarkii]